MSLGRAGLACAAARVFAERCTLVRAAAPASPVRGFAAPENRPPARAPMTALHGLAARTTAGRGGAPAMVLCVLRTVQRVALAVAVDGCPCAGRRASGRHEPDAPGRMIDARRCAGEPSTEWSMGSACPPACRMCLVADCA